MSTFKTAYDLKLDTRQIKTVQSASLDPLSRYGYKIENDLLFGTAEWFNALDGHVIKGIISKVYMAGMNDFPQFEIESAQGITTWIRTGDDSMYKIGRNVELIYVEQKFKTDATLRKCVIRINIEE